MELNFGVTFSLLDFSKAFDQLELTIIWLDFSKAFDFNTIILLDFSAAFDSFDTLLKKRHKHFAWF